MNHLAFRIAMFLIFLYLAAIAAAGFWMHPRYPDAYQTFKDMIPVLIAIAAAALTGCVQRRISFLTEVRKLYGQSSMDSA